MTTPGSGVTARAIGSASKSPAVSDDGIPDDDSISSTIHSQADSDTQWNFERVLCEAPNEDGDPWYLIQWTGYDKDDWTWEPKENITDVGLDEWSETKAKIDRGEVEPFDIEGWLEDAAAIKKAKQSAQRERHRKRNLKRKRQGMPMNLLDDEREQDYDSSDVEVNNDDDFNDIIPPPRPPGEDAPRPKAPAAPKSPNLPGDLQLKRKVSGEKPSQQPGSASAETLALRKASVNQKTTGYQGTARKSSSTTRPRPLRDLAGTAARSINTAGGPSQSNTDSTMKKAKRSAGEKTTCRSATGNVFISGKKTKARPKFTDAMIDPSKEARLFSNYHITRKAELKVRDKADKAPGDIRQLGLFNISTGAAQASNSNASGASRHPVEPSSAKEKRPSIEGIKSSLKKKSHSEAFNDNDARQEPLRKKSRSVHFTGDTITGSHSEPGAAPYPKDLPLANEPESIDSDDNELFVGRSSGRSLPLRPPSTAFNTSSLRQKSLQDVLGRSKTQTVKKRISLGPTSSAETDVLFEDIPIAVEPWIGQLTGTDPLVFDRIFTAKDFESQCQQHPSLSNGILAYGSLRSDDQTTTQLENAAEHLLLGSFGVLHYDASFCIIVYPSKCEDWAACFSEIERSSPLGVALKYMVFRPNFSAAKPLTVTDGISHETVSSNRVNIMRTMFGFKYDELLPTRLLKEQGRHNFYLAFPPNRDLILNKVAAWLTEAKPDCQIFSSQRAGDWAAFVDLGRKQSGTIIIHELATPLIRRFPGIGPLLHRIKNVAYSLWSLGEAVQDHPPSPSTGEQSSEPGQVGFTRLFPHGNAVLVTPSFFLTQPIQACRLLIWYSTRIATPMFHTKLVLSASIVDFLRELAHEKVSQREMLFSRSSRQSRSELEVQAKQQGVSQEDCAARLETLSTVIDLIDSGKGNLIDEVQEPFVYVDDCIDANDEQSLGNWFGFWSLTKLDCYRKFHILGSHENDYSRSLRDVRIPRYAPKTTGDPDQAYAQAEQAVADINEPTRALDNSGAQSQILGRADGEEFGRYLTSDQFIHVRGLMKLYGFAVSWFNDSFQMADHFGDTSFKFKTYRNWFSYTFPFGQNKGYNTYVALFYTIELEWDPAAYPQKRFSKRHPWIGIWRVRNPHLQPYRSTELLIWDVTARERVSSDSLPHMGSLIPAQRALVDFVEQNSAEKNPGMPLYQVWLGGLELPPLQSTTNLDRTLEMLEIMLSDVKKWLPAPDPTLPTRGWRKVNLRQASPVPDAVDRQTDVVDERPEKIIFHPPCDHGMRGGIGRSKCGNVLFQEVSKMRLADKTRKYLSYRFPPTLEWYTRQKAEGRHYEYINVDSGEGVFSSIGAPTVDGKLVLRKENAEVESTSTSAQTTPRN